MRYVLIALLLVCPASARCDEAPAGTDVIARYEALVAKAAAESKERDEAAAKAAAEHAEKVDGSLKEVAQTVGNTNNELNAIAEQFKATNATLKAFADEWRSWRDAEKSPAVAVPQPAEKKPDDTADAAFNAIGIALDGISKEIQEMKTDGSLIQVTLANGEKMSVREFIDKWYKGPRQFPGNVDDHLRAHGASDFGDLSEETKQKWHAAIHELGDHLLQQKKSPPPAKRQQPTMVAAPTPIGWRKVCENGVCRWVPIMPPAKGRKG